MVIGAAWNGARAFTPTSGPGISLMEEFIGLAYYAEVLRAAPGSREACAGLRRIGHHMELPPEMLTGCPTADLPAAPTPEAPPDPS